MVPPVVAKYDFNRVLNVAFTLPTAHTGTKLNALKIVSFFFKTNELYNSVYFLHIIK